MKYISIIIFFFAFNLFSQDLNFRLAKGDSNFKFTYDWFFTSTDTLQYWGTDNSGIVGLYDLPSGSLSFWNEDTTKIINFLEPISKNNIAIQLDSGFFALDTTTIYRGKYAIDFQRVRLDTTYVAKADYSTILNGQSNRIDASSQYSLINGINNLLDSSQSYYSIFGNGNIIAGSGNYGLISGNLNTLSGSGDNHYIFGTGNSIVSSGGSNFILGTNNSTSNGATESYIFGNSNVFDGVRTFAFGEFNKVDSLAANTYIFGSNDTLTADYSVAFGANVKSDNYGSINYGVNYRDGKHGSFIVIFSGTSNDISYSEAFIHGQPNERLIIDTNTIYTYTFEAVAIAMDYSEIYAYNEGATYWTYNVPPSVVTSSFTVSSWERTGGGGTALFKVYGDGTCNCIKVEITSGSPKEVYFNIILRVTYVKG